MKATKTSALVSGMGTAITGAIVQSYDLSFLVVALVFFPSAIIFVIGLEVSQKWAKSGAAIYLLFGPEDKDALIRMFIYFLGGATTAEGISAWANI